VEPANRREALIVAKVAGVAYANRDGSSRQRFISECRSGDAVHFRREPDNAYDRNAIMVPRANGGQLGYLPATVASEIAPQMDSGVAFVGRIENIAIWDDGTRGLDIVLQVAAPARGLLRTIRSWFSRG
jgi:hypothetical protein